MEQCLKAAAYETTRDGAQLPLTIDIWSALICAMIAEIGDLKIHEEVGGPISAAYTIRGESHGVGALQVAFTDGEAIFRDISLGPLEAKTVRQDTWTHRLLEGDR